MASDFSCNCFFCTDELAQKGIIIPLNENTLEDGQIQSGEGQPRSVDNRHDAEVCTETVLYHRGDADLDDMETNVNQLSLSSSSDDDYADSDYEKEGLEKGDDEGKNGKLCMYGARKSEEKNCHFVISK